MQWESLLSLLSFPGCHATNVTPFQKSAFQITLGNPRQAQKPSVLERTPLHQLWGELLAATRSVEITNRDEGRGQLFHDLPSVKGGCVAAVNSSSNCRLSSCCWHLWAP